MVEIGKIVKENVKQMFLVLLDNIAQLNIQWKKDVLSIIISIPSTLWLIEENIK